MKMTTFTRNAIITGYINSYCLPCETFFETEDETFSHIREADHGTKLQLYPYIEKFGNNHIRKVKVGYFCEHCGLLMATAIKVNLHVVEKQHYNNKGNSLLKQFGSILTAFDDVLISENAWHSFSDDVCAICDTEFDESDEHKVDNSHVIKLLQKKVEFGENNNIYRRIDKNDAQCLTCNCVVQNTIEDHFNSDDHKQKYQLCQEEKKKYDLANPKEKVKNKIEVKATENLNNKGTITGNDVTKEELEKARNTSERTGTKQTIKVIVKENSKPILKEIENAQNPATFAKENKLVYDPVNVNAFCKTCGKKFPSTLHSMKEHVFGRDHINKTVKAAIKSAPKKTKLDKQIMEEFVKSVSTFHNTLDNDTVLNESICVSEKSCHFFTKIALKFAEYRCQICLMNIGEDELDEHCQTAQHERGMRQAQIVLTVKNEFIREIRPETFHCGFCNLMLSSWSVTEEHLKTTQHKTSSAACQRRLQIHMPAIRAERKDEQVKAALFQMFLQHMNR